MLKADVKSLVKKLNPYCTNALEASIGLSMQSGHAEVTALHWLDKLLHDPKADFAAMLDAEGIDRMLFQNAVRQELAKFTRNLGTKPAFAADLFDWIQDAWLFTSLTLNEAEIRSGALFLALLPKSRLALAGTALQRLAKISTRTAQQHFLDFAPQSIEATFQAEQEHAANKAQADSALAQFGEDLTLAVRAHKIDPVLGREPEIRQMIDILCRRRKNNPILVGEAGVGKTALVEGLAAKIVQGHVPERLAAVRVITLDLGLIAAGASVKGEFERRLKAILAEVENSLTPIILFIDEAHLLIGAGGQEGQDAANLLKPALARGKIRVIAATTWSEYKKYIEKDPALSRRFQQIKVGEPDLDQTLTILRGLRAIFEENHGVIVRDDALQACARLSTKYLPDRQQPDKAIDVMDTACARVHVNLKAKPAPIADLEESLHTLGQEEAGLLKDAHQGIKIDALRLTELAKTQTEIQQTLKIATERWQQELIEIEKLLEIRLQIDVEMSQGKKRKKLYNARERIQKKLTALRGRDPLLAYEVDPDVMAGVIADWTHIPLGKLLRDEAENLLILQAQFEERIKGQPQGLALIAQQIKQAKAGLKDPAQPLGVFLLVGPSGVGKTETALTVADTLFGGEESVITINMSEFQEKHSISRLIGSPPGYVGYGEGGMLTEAVRKRPYSVVLLDEVEKAHPDVLNLFYQVFDKGSLTDGEGREVDFKNTVLFLTSNLASERIMELSLGEATFAAIIDDIRPVLSAWFKPALLARMTVIPYQALSEESLLEILAEKCKKLEARLKNQYQINLEWQPDLSKWLVAQCQDLEMGARNIDLILTKKIMPPLTEYVLMNLSERTFAPKISIERNAETGEIMLHFKAE